MTQDGPSRPADKHRSFQESRRDPLAGRLLGAGKPFELEEVLVAGRPQQVFKGEPRTLEQLYRRAAAFGARPLVVHDDATLSYAEVFGQAAALAAVMRREFGIAPGMTVAIAMSNRPEFIVSLVAVTAMGAVAALINSRGVAEEMQRAIALSGSRLVLLDAERAGILEAATPDPDWERIVVGGAGLALRPQRDRDFAAAVEALDGMLEPVGIDPGDGAVVLFTSGTTGFPKGALLSHGAIAHAVALSSFMGALQDLHYETENGETLPHSRRSMTSPTVILPPMFHLSGMLPIFRSIGVGTAIHIMSKWNADIAFDMMESSGMSRLSFVPAMLWDMFRSPRANPRSLGRLLFMVSGGAPITPDLVGEIKVRTPRCLIVNTYGQSENGAWACSMCGHAYLDNRSACGWAVPTVNVTIRRDDGTEADIGEPGEIWTSSACTMTGYVGDPEATREALRDGWLATGDIGRLDANGLFSVVDRKKNMVISGGENIYCAEVERVLSMHPAVLECVCYGLPDDRLGERLVARIAVAPASVLDADEVKRHCRLHLAIYKVPREVIVQHDGLPRTASGKIERRYRLPAAP